MEGFINTELLLSLAGCVGIVMVITQLVKKYIKVDPKIIALVSSIVIGVIRVIVKEDYDVSSIIVGLLNIIPILWGATGGYDIMTKQKQNQIKEKK